MTLGLDWLASQAWDLLSSPSSTGVTSTYLALLGGYWGSYSGSHAFTVNPLWLSPLSSHCADLLAH